jgi:hypothetical protein
MEPKAATSNFPKTVKAFSKTLALSIQQLQTLHNNGRVIEAHKLITEIKATFEHFKGQKFAKGEQTRLVNATKLWTAQKALIDTVEQNYADTMTILPEFDRNDEVWEQYDYGDYCCGFKKVNENAYKVKLEGKMKCSITQLAAIGNEVDLYKALLPNVLGFGLKSSTEIQRSSRLSFIAHMETSIPFITSPDLAIESIGVDLMDQKGKVLVLLKNAPASTPGLPNGKCPRAELFGVGGCLITVLNEKEIHGAMIFSIGSSIKWALKTFSGVIWSSLTSRACAVGASPKCPYQARIDAQPEFYDFLLQRYAEWKASETCKEGEKPHQPKLVESVS